MEILQIVFAKNYEHDFLNFPKPNKLFIFQVTFSFASLLRTGAWIVMAFLVCVYIGLSHEGTGRGRVFPSSAIVGEVAESGRRHTLEVAS